MNPNDLFGNRYVDAHLSKVKLPDETLEKISNWVKNPKNMFTFIGNPGLGKTYLCAAIYKAMKEKNAKNPYFSIRYLKEYLYFGKLRQIIDAGWDYNHEITTICHVDFLMLDDMFSRDPNDWQKEVLFNLIDNRYNSGLPTIITSNIWTKDMIGLTSQRFVSRLTDNKNLLIELDWIDKRQQD